MTEHKCTCAVCMGFEPWVTRFAQCIQVGWIRAAEAVAAGIATRVPHE